MKIHFFGAAGEVTGSCFLVESHDVRVLIDCGLFQGAHDADSRNRAPFVFDPTTLDAVIVTHPHLDHCGRVPQLVARGYRGSIFATEPATALMHLQWDDTLQIMHAQAAREGKDPLYEDPDVERARRQTRALRYGDRQAIRDDVTFTLHDAGHIFGSAFIELRGGAHTVVFSGDIGNDDVPIIRNTQPLSACDVLVTEATYGDRTHASPHGRREQLRKIILQAIARGGALMIPAFSLERTQEILYELDALIEQEHALPRVPIYLDSPLATAANEVYRAFPKYYDEDAAAQVRRGNDFFSFPGLHVTRTVAESKQINGAPNPKIIIAGSGMMNGGRIVHHLMRYLPDPKSTLLVVSYQAEGTLGRKIVERSPLVTINGERIPVRCHMERIDAYSAHGDQEKLLRWMVSGPRKPGQVVVVHADPPSATAFVQLVERTHHVTAHAARAGEVMEL